MKQPSCFEELVGLYGKPWESDKAAAVFERNYMTLWRAEHWEEMNCRKFLPPFKKIYCNKDLVPVMNFAFLLLDSKNLIQELNTFDGCLSIRRIRGRNDKWSVHSFGIALDFNALENPLGGPVRFSEKFLDAMEASGFVCGARFDRKDGMHFQWASGC